VWLGRGNHKSSAPTGGEAKPTKIARAIPLLWFVGMALTGAALAQVSIPAVVVDGSGQVVHGLQKSDFSVTCGQAATFDAVEEVAPAAVSNFSDPTPVFILYDAPFIDPRIQGKLSALLLAFLREAADDRLPVTLFKNTGTGVQVIHDLSVEPAVLAAALDRVAPEKGRPQSSAPPAPSAGDFQKKVDEEAAWLHELTRGVIQAPASQRIETLQRVGALLQRSRKRKMLLWITGDFNIAMEPDCGHKMVVNRPLSQQDLEELSYEAKICGPSRSPLPTVPTFSKTAQTLNDSRISLYLIRLGSVTDCCLRPAEEPPKNAFDAIARGTGGSCLPSKEVDLASAIAALRRQFGAYYLLTVTPVSAPKGSWTACSIGVSNPDLKAVTTDGFFPR